MSTQDKLPPKRGTVDYAEWLADKLHNGGDYGKEAAALLVQQAKALAAAQQAEPVAMLPQVPNEFGHLLTSSALWEMYVEDGPTVSPPAKEERQAVALTEEQMESVRGAAYTALLQRGFNGGMGGETWDDAHGRAVERAVWIANNLREPT